MQGGELLYAREMATRLAGSSVRNVTLAGGGANSRVYRIDTSVGPFALKSYPNYKGDSRPRASVELKALTFLRANGVDSVPRPIAVDEGGQFLLMEWVHGNRVERHEVADVQDAACFVSTVMSLSDRPSAGQLPLASEACLSAAEIVRQIEVRIGVLNQVLSLAPFIAVQILPRLEARKRDLANEISDGQELDLSNRRLIPADFGFHNALRVDGRLRYIDFDYFGWDDPVKLVSDFILHPAMSLKVAEIRIFADAVRDVIPRDRDFTARLRRYLPLFGLRWALILFNPLRPDCNSGSGRSAEPDEKELLTRIRRAQAVVDSSESILERL